MSCAQRLRLIQPALASSSGFHQFLGVADRTARTHNDRGVWVYRDHGATSERAAFSLSEVYASVSAGGVVVLDGTSLVQWHVRMLADFGAIELPPLDLPQLAHARPGSVDRHVRDGVRLVFQVRAAAGFRPETPLARSFLSAWAGVHEGSVYAARCRLRDAGIIERAGEAGRMHLWRANVVTL